MAGDTAKAKAAYQDFLTLWKDAGPDVPVLNNYRARVLKKLAEQLGLPKLNFKVLRRTIATLAQKKSGVKDVQGILGHAKADTTVKRSTCRRSTKA